MNAKDVFSTSTRRPDLRFLLDLDLPAFIAARVRWHASRYESLRDGGLDDGRDMSAALGCLQNVATTLHHQRLPEEAWQRLLGVMVWTAAIGDGWAEIHHTFLALSPRAWPTAQGQTRLPGLWTIFASLADVGPNTETGAETGARAVGEELTTLFASSPLGPYVVAHFMEAYHRRRQSWTESELRRIEANFEAAERLASTSGTSEDAELAAHCRLRRGVLWLSLRRRSDEGRKLLQTIHPSRLKLSDRLWYAYGLLHSPFWLDRVRSADVLDDLAITIGDDLRKSSGQGLAMLREVGQQLLHRAPLGLSVAEVDRLRALETTLFKDSPVFGPGSVGHWRELIDIRLDLANCRTLPIEDAPKAYAVLDRLARATQGPGGDWDQAFAHFAQLSSVYNLASGSGSGSGEDASILDEQGLQLPTMDRAFRLGAIVTSALLAHGQGDQEAVEVALRALRDALIKHDAAEDNGPLGPLALLWPALLARSPRDKTIREMVEDIARRWARVGKEPSYGWWLASAHFFEAGLPEAGCAIAHRAIQEGAADDARARDYALARAVDHAVARGTPEELRRWLLEVRPA